MKIRGWTVLAVAAMAASAGATTPGARLTLTPGDREPQQIDKPTDDAIAALRAKVDETPKDREARFALVRALMRAGKLTDALDAAKAWRATDAYNLVVVRLIGDIYSELGRRNDARRAYSAVVELLPKDATAQRALASVLVQAGDLAGAYDRIAAAEVLTPGDPRLEFARADLAARLGHDDEAKERFTAIVADAKTPPAVSYPANQRLAQLEHRAKNDIKVYLTWDTDKSDVDLWVTNPAGERVFYSHKKGQFGEALYDDVTTGYGPESFTAPHAHAGDYLVQVNYFGAGRSNFSEARGEVVVILDEGKPTETRHVLPYRLFEVKQTVSVARIHVEGAE